MSLSNYYQTCAIPKGVTRKRAKGRKDRAEAKVKKDVRADVDARDGSCLLQRMVIADVMVAVNGELEDWRCAGQSEWAHGHSHRRSQTRGQAPEVRHTTAASFKACTKHHDMYDGRRKPRLKITRLTRAGFNGPVRLRLGAK